MPDNRTNSNNSDSGRRPPSTVKEFLRRSAKPFGLLLLFIMICGFLAQYLTGAETLEQYAKNNPELAYGDGSSGTEPSGGLIPGDDVSSADTDTNADASSMPAASSSGSETVSVRETPDKTPAYTISEESGPDADGTSKASRPDTDGIPEKSRLDTDGIAERSKPDTDSITNPDQAEVNEENKNMATNPERTVYQDGFYYEPLSDTVKEKITGISYPETGCTVPYEDLNYVGLLYVDFDGEVQEGELICNRAIAQDMVEIFYELYQNDYRIERIRLIDEYGGDDTLSMMDNNTSCFNYRVVDGTTNLSKHALGCAIDINPFYNPYVVYNRNGSGETYISPKGSEVYADRSQNFPYKIDENDLCYKLFISHGFTWGGNWNSSKDYQHFQIVL